MFAEVFSPLLHAKYRSNPSVAPLALPVSHPIVHLMSPATSLNKTDGSTYIVLGATCQKPVEKWLDDQYALNRKDIVRKPLLSRSSSEPSMMTVPVIARSSREGSESALYLQLDFEVRDPGSADEWTSAMTALLEAVGL